MCLDEKNFLIEESTKNYEFEKYFLFSLGKIRSNLNVFRWMLLSGHKFTRTE